IDIDGGTNHSMFARHLFGSHVAGRAKTLRRQGLLRLAIDQLGQAKVGDLGDWYARLGAFRPGLEQDVAWLEIAMQDPALMRIMHGTGEDLHERCGDLRGPGRAAKVAIEAPAV